MCVFCGGRDATKALTREHVVARVVASSLDLSASGIDMARLSIRQGRLVDRRNVATASFTLKSVCASCNNGWMSELDKAAAAILPRMDPATDPLRPSLDEASVLASWAAKTATTLGFATAYDDIFSEADVRSLFETNRPSADVYIDLVSIPGQPSLGWSQTHTGMIFGLSSGEMRKLPWLPGWIVLDIGWARFRIVQRDRWAFQCRDVHPGVALRMWPNPQDGVVVRLSDPADPAERQPYGMGLVLERLRPAGLWLPSPKAPQ